MRVIILAAGTGTRMRPFTGSTPKCLFRLGKQDSILSRMVKIVKRSSDSGIYIVTGFQHEKIEKSLLGANFIYNPFYRVTNSIVSLWFAREHLDEDVIIINSDVVIEEALFRETLKISNPATVLVDSSAVREADYKVVTRGERVLIMSKELGTCSGEYAGITKLSKASAVALRHKIEAMIAEGQIDEWYENALVRMILEDGFVLNYLDIPQFRWTEVDTVDDWLTAKTIHEDEALDDE